MISSTTLSSTSPWGVRFREAGIGSGCFVQGGVALDAVRAVLGGADVVEVAKAAGVHRATLHRWLARYLSEQLAGLTDRSHRPTSCPHQVEDAVEIAVAEMRRDQERLGHAGATVTMKVYAKVLKGRRAVAAQVFAEAMGDR